MHGDQSDSNERTANGEARPALLHPQWRRCPQLSFNGED